MPRVGETPASLVAKYQAKAGAFKQLRSQAGAWEREIEITAKGMDQILPPFGTLRTSLSAMCGVTSPAIPMHQIPEDYMIPLSRSSPGLGNRTHLSSRPGESPALVP